MTKPTTYNAIDDDPAPEVRQFESESDVPSSPTLGINWSKHTTLFIKIFLLLLGGFLLVEWIHVTKFSKHSSSSSSSSSQRDQTIYTQPKTNSINNNNFFMPRGVNVGSWLSLEDFFYVGRDGGAVEVATPFGKTAARCLPPLASTGPSWHSETDLLTNVTKQTSLAHALRVFQAHRVSYLDWEEDLATLQRLGMDSIRVPLTWCLTDHDPSTISGDESVELLREKFTCVDPYFGESVLWPAVPRPFLARFLRACAQYGIGAVLDMHTYPGGTSIGTFSGVWPRWPRFWTHGDQPATDLGAIDIGRQLYQDMIQWVESLSQKDPEAFAGVRAVSPMNEPAHLAGLFGGPDPVVPEGGPFLPELPPDMAESFLNELNGGHSGKTKRTKIPDGPHLRVLLWLRDAISTFRESSLPSLGKQLHVNVHESVFAPRVLPPNDGNDDGGRHPGATRILASWWRGVTSRDERTSWAVLDMHHYHAWEPMCMGTTDGTGNYTCGDVEARSEALHRCSSWATMYRQMMDEECGHPGSLLASAEFSASTHHLVRRACNDVGTLRASYQAQTQAAHDANVELFWWSFKMPYGGAFRPAWSFQHFMYLMGVLPFPDESAINCGEHVAAPEAPNDDEF